MMPNGLDQPSPASEAGPNQVSEALRITKKSSEESDLIFILE
jgi:hypothetical protein